MMNDEEITQEEAAPEAAEAEEAAEAPAAEEVEGEEGVLPTAPTAPEVEEEEEEEEVMQAGGTVVEWEFDAEGTIKLSAEPREVTGTTECNRLREEEGLLPGNIYGKKIEGARPIQFDRDTAHHKLVRWRGEDIEVELDGERYNVEVREVDRNPVTRDWQHVDLYSTGLAGEDQTGNGSEPADEESETEE